MYSFYTKVVVDLIILMNFGQFLNEANQKYLALIMCFDVLFCSMFIRHSLMFYEKQASGICLELI